MGVKGRRRRRCRHKGFMSSPRGFREGSVGGCVAAGDDDAAATHEGASSHSMMICLP